MNDASTRGARSPALPPIAHEQAEGARARAPRTQGLLEDRLLYAIMTTVLVAIAAYLLVGTYGLHQTLLSSDIADIDATFRDGALASSGPYVTAQVYITLLRYRQASFALYTRALRRHAGFLIGAVMVLTGAMFVVRRIELASATTGGFEAAQVKADFTSTSPGLALAFMGTLVLALTMFQDDSVTVTDEGIRPEPYVVLPGAGGSSTNDKRSRGLGEASKDIDESTKALMRDLDGPGN